MLNIVFFLSAVTRLGAAVCVVLCYFRWCWSLSVFIHQFVSVFLPAVFDRRWMNETPALISFKVSLSVRSPPVRVRAGCIRWMECFWGLTCCQMDDLSVTSQLPALNSQQSQYWYVRNLAPSDTEEFKDKQLRILPGMKQVCSHEGFMQEAVQVHHWKIYESICLETRWLNNSSVHWIFHFSFFSLVWLSVLFLFCQIQQPGHFPLWDRGLHEKWFVFQMSDTLFVIVVEQLHFVW